MHLSSKVTERLGHYVYLYVDPRDEAIFYVGKGSGGRCLTHLSDGDDTEKVKRIAAIQDSGLEPRIDVLVHGLPTAKAALQVEAAVIDVVGREHLTNQVRGWESGVFGRMELMRLISLYDPKPVHIEEPSLLIRINQLLRFGMTPIELYDATRGIWRIGPDRDQIRLAFAVFQGVVREVYRVSQWMPAGSSFSTRMTEEDDLQDPERWEFVGVLAEAAVRKKYIDGSVRRYLRRNVRSPFVYVNVKASSAGS